MIPDRLGDRAGSASGQVQVQDDQIGSDALQGRLDLARVGDLLGHDPNAPQYGGDLPALAMVGIHNQNAPPCRLRAVEQLLDTGDHDRRVERRLEGGTRLRMLL